MELTPSEIMTSRETQELEFSNVLVRLSISQLRTATHLWIVWRKQLKWQKTALTVETGARLKSHRGKATKVVVLFVPRLMTHAL